MEVEEIKLSQALTEEEIQQIRKMLAEDKERELQTVISSKASFLEWLRTIPALFDIVEQIQSFSWEKIVYYIKDLLD